MNNQSAILALLLLAALGLLAAIFKKGIAARFLKGFGVWTMRRIAFFCAGATLTADFLMYLLPNAFWARLGSDFALFTVAAAILSLREKE